MFRSDRYDMWAFVPLTIIEIAGGASFQPTRWSMECNAVYLPRTALLAERRQSVRHSSCPNGNNAEAIKPTQ